MKPDPALAAVLGASPPDAISALPAQTQSRLAEQIAAAKKRGQAETEASVEKAIAGVPFAVRGIVKKAVL